MFMRSVVRRRPVRRTHWGFTLVEILVACALFLVVLTLMVQTLVPTMVACRKAADRVDLHQRATLLGERMAQDLRASSRAAVGLFPSAGGQSLSIHPRQQDTGMVAWQDRLRVYDWNQAAETVIGSTATLAAVPMGPLVPLPGVMDGLPKQQFLRVEGVKTFTFQLDPGPSARLGLTLAKGVESFEFSRLVFFRNGAD